MALQRATLNEGFTLAAPKGRLLNRHTERNIPLALALQTTLDLETMLKVLLNELRRTIAIDGMVYQESRLGVEMQLDGGGRHTANYKLELFERSLGEITFYRRRRFSEQEMEALEPLLAAALYPLHNALLYREALNRAQRDPLTGINNRMAFTETLQRELNRCQRSQTTMALLVVDIDLFKRVNDTYGHSSGDAVLRTVAQELKQSIRLSDELFRFGGEEFVALLPLTGYEGAVVIAERMRQRVEQLTVTAQNQTIQTTISIGFATYQSADSEDSLFNRADQALYAAKTGGRNRVVGG